MICTAYSASVSQSLSSEYDPDDENNMIFRDEEPLYTDDIKNTDKENSDTIINNAYANSLDEPLRYCYHDCDTTKDLCHKKCASRRYDMYCMSTCKTEYEFCNYFCEVFYDSSSYGRRR